MGRGVKDVQDELKLFPFRIAADNADGESVIKLRLGSRALTPPEISAAVLRQLKDNAEAALGARVTEAVITVPAYFNDAQRQATKDAGRLAGLEVLRLVNEPTAASLAYGLDKRKEGVIAVYDFGGGTFDVSILRLHDGIFEVLATNGDTHLGGDDIDNLLLRIAIEDIGSEWGGDFGDDPEGVQRLRRAVIEAKEELSFVPPKQIDLEYNGTAYQRVIDRALFERLIAPIVETYTRTVPCMPGGRQALARTDQRSGHGRRIDTHSAGENSRRTSVQGEASHRTESRRGGSVGCGRTGRHLAGDVEDQLLLDVTPLSLGIETMGGVVSKLIHRNSTIPASATESFTTAVDGQRNVLIHVLQGERELVKDCRSLARFDLKNIDPVPAGFARIEVRFLIDANGILNVTARDARTGKEQSVEVKPSYGLSEDQVEAMIQESFDRAAKDMRERQMREARVEADSILLATEKAQRNDAWASLSEQERQQIESAQRDLLATYHSADHNIIHAKLDALNQATMTLAENMMSTAVRGALKGTKID